jgi:predicted transcriptional regulator
MFVSALLQTASKDLVTIADGALLIEAAKMLHAGTDLLVVCGADGKVVGVVSKTDVVAQISQCLGAGCTCPVSSVMTRDVLMCRADDALSAVWTAMKTRGLKNVPLVDSHGKPIGLVTARAALAMLLSGSEQEESLLRDYVMGFGYR